MTCIWEGRVVLVPCPQMVTVTLVQLSVDLKQTHKAELIFNLVLFHFLKIKSSLSRLFGAGGFLCNRMQWIPILVSAKSKQAQPRCKEWEGEYSGLPEATAS